MGEGLKRHGGGKGGNSAVAAVRAGADVRYVGAVGDDDFGTTAVEELRAEGIDVTVRIERTKSDDEKLGTLGATVQWIEAEHIDEGAGGRSPARVRDHGHRRLPGSKPQACGGLSPSSGR